MKLWAWESVDNHRGSGKGLGRWLQKGGSEYSLGFGHLIRIGAVGCPPSHVIPRMPQVSRLMEINHADTRPREAAE